MSQKAVFSGLVVDENDRPVDVTMIGGEACYVVNDAGFHRHIPAEQVDRQVLEFMKEQIKGNEHLISEQTSKMLGQQDLFTVAGIPEEGRAYMGMMGMRIIINVHGEVVRIDQPSAPASDEDQ
jgi:hypothetical protein